MNSLAIICCCTHRQGLIDEYQAQVEAAGIPFFVQPMKPSSGNEISLGNRLEAVQNALRAYDYEKLVFTDAYDVLFFGTANDVFHKIPDYVLMAAERNCYPESSLAPALSEVASRRIHPVSITEVRARYVNGGMIAGGRHNLEAWIAAIESHSEYEPGYSNDQGWFNRRLAENSSLVQIDYLTNLMYCLCEEQGELKIKDGRPWNSVNGTYPAFLHLNGRIDVSVVRRLFEEARNNP